VTWNSGLEDSWFNQPSVCSKRHHLGYGLEDSWFNQPSVSSKRHHLGRGFEDCWFNQPSVCSKRNHLGCALEQFNAAPGSTAARTPNRVRFRGAMIQCSTAPTCTARNNNQSAVWKTCSSFSPAYARHTIYVRATWQGCTCKGMLLHSHAPARPLHSHAPAQPCTATAMHSHAPAQPLHSHCTAMHLHSHASDRVAPAQPCCCSAKHEAAPKMLKRYNPQHGKGGHFCWGQQLCYMDPA